MKKSYNEIAGLLNNINLGDPTAGSLSISGGSPPSIPTALAATNVTDVSFQANWLEVTPAPTGYYLYLYQSDGTTLISKTDIGNVSSYSVTGRTQNTTYKYTISAYNTTGESAQSSQISVTTYTTYAQTYFNNVFTNGDSSLTVAQKNAWNARAIKLIAIGTDQHLDALFPAICPECQTQIQARTAFSLSGNFLAVPFGSPTWANGVGWTHNGSSYLDTRFVPTTNGVHYTLNNAGIYMGVTPVLSGDKVYCAQRIAPNFTYGIEVDSSKHPFTGINGAAEVTDGTTVPSPFNYFHSRRTNSTTVKMQYGTSTEATLTLSSTSLLAISFYTTARNNNGTADVIANNGTIERWLGLGDSSLTSSSIETALTT